MTIPEPSPTSDPEREETDESPLLLNESLVPPQTHKKPTTTTLDFDNLLIPTTTTTTTTSSALRLHEDLKEGCGGQLWPAGMVLAKYLLRRHRTDFRDKTILELGAGGGLVGLAVAKGCWGGASGGGGDRSDAGTDSGQGPSMIWITDQEAMYRLMLQNIALNDLSSKVRAKVLDWGTPIPSEILDAKGKVDVVLAADCVYFEPAFPLLLHTLRELLVTEETVCYFCFKKRRRADGRFMKMARKVFSVVEVADDDEGERERYSKDQIFLYTFRKKTR